MVSTASVMQAYFGAAVQGTRVRVQPQGWFDMRKMVATEVNLTGSDFRILYLVRMDSSDRRFRFHGRKVGLTGDGYMRDRWWTLAMGTAWRSVHWK